MDKCIFHEVNERLMNCEGKGERLMAISHWPLAWVYLRTVSSFTAEKRRPTFAKASVGAEGDCAEERGLWLLAIGHWLGCITELMVFTAEKPAFAEATADIASLR